MPDISVSVEALNIDVGIAVTGPQGPAGATGEGVPTGGSTGQVLTKLSATDYDADWENPGASNNYETYPAGENLSTGRLVVIDAGEAFYFQPANSAHAGRCFGITKSSAVTGANVTIQPDGVVSDPAFSFTPDVGLWAATNGQITSTKPTSGLIQFVGISVEADKMRLEFTSTVQ